MVITIAEKDSEKKETRMDVEIDGERRIRHVPVPITMDVSDDGDDGDDEMKNEK